MDQSLSHSIHSVELWLLFQARSSLGCQDQAFGVRIERLKQELSAKTRTIQELSRSVDRLQKEKRKVPSLSSHHPPTEQQRKERTPAAEDTFPAPRYQKTYKPSIFTGTTGFNMLHPHTPEAAVPVSADGHISDVLEENQALKQHLEHLELRSEQEKEEKEALQVEVAQAREELLRYD